MNKGSHVVMESVITRLCEWRGLNVCCKMFVARKRNCGDTILQTVDKAPSCEGALSTVCLFIVIFSFPNHASYFL